MGQVLLRVRAMVRGKVRLPVRRRGRIRFRHQLWGVPEVVAQDLPGFSLHGAAVHRGQHLQVALCLFVQIANMIVAMSFFLVHAVLALQQNGGRGGERSREQGTESRAPEIDCAGCRASSLGFAWARVRSCRRFAWLGSVPLLALLALLAKRGEGGCFFSPQMPKGASSGSSFYSVFSMGSRGDGDCAVDQSWWAVLRFVNGGPGLLRRTTARSTFGAIFRHPMKSGTAWCGRRSILQTQIK